MHRCFGNGQKCGLVELTFYIKEEKILKKLEALDIYPEDGYLTLSRRLLEGRSVSKINGETVNMSVLKDVASLLIDIHGQHDNQTLLHRKNHLTLLDLYGKEQTDPLKEKWLPAIRNGRQYVRRWNNLRWMKRAEEENFLLLNLK